MLAKARERSLICSPVVGIHKIPVNILHLGDGGDHLCFEGKVGDLRVALGDADKALVGRDSETGQKGLRDNHLKIGIELRIDEVVGRVAGDALAEIVDRQVGADGERLGVIRQDLNGVVLQNRHAGRDLVGLLCVVWST